MTTMPNGACLFLLVRGVPDDCKALARMVNHSPARRNEQLAWPDLAALACNLHLVVDDVFVMTSRCFHIQRLAMATASQQMLPGIA